MPWPCAKAHQLKTFVHQDFYGIHLGAFGGSSNTHISKTTNFIFSQNSPPSNLALPWCTDQFGHMQNPTNSKVLCTNTFMVFIWRNFDANPTLTSQKPRISFFHKTPHLAISSYVVVHRPTWPCAKPNQLKTFVHQDFHGINLGAFGGQSNPHISKTTNFIFSQNSARSHLAMPWCTDQLGHVQNPTKSQLSCTKTSMVFIWGHLESNPILTSQKRRISFFHKTPHQEI